MPKSQAPGPGLREGLTSLVAPTWLVCLLDWLEWPKDNAWNVELSLSLDTGIKIVNGVSARRLRSSLSLGVPASALSRPTPSNPRPDNGNWKLTESHSILAKLSACN